MFENLKDITIQGGCFETKTDLQGVLAFPINIMYGMNGTGKSSIARAFANYAKPNEEHPFLLTFDVEIPEGYRERVFVFNEDFVDENVKVGNDGLNGIVMLGETGKYMDEIDNLLAQKKSLIQDCGRHVKELDGDENTKGLRGRKEEQWKKLKEELHREGCADHRYQQIKGNKTRVATDIEKVLSADCTGLNRQALQDDIAKGIEFLKSSKDLQQIAWTKPMLSRLPIEAINELLVRQLREAKLSSDDDFLLRVAADFQQVRRTQELVNAKEKRCPLCHQPIGVDVMNELREFVLGVLNDDVAEFQIKVREAIDGIGDFTPVNQVLPDIFAIEKNAVDNASMAMGVFTARVKTALTKRLDSPYDALEAFDVAEYDELYKALSEAISLLDGRIAEYNGNVKKRQTVINKLIEQNIQLARLENEQLANDIIELQASIEKASANLCKVENDIAGIELKIKEYKHQMEQTGIAMDFINDCISLVFAGSDRLRLEATDDAGKYRLTSRGKALAPKNVSVGERNILALAYFFASISRGQSRKEQYSAESLVVIDDPISSFDKGSRAGVMALLRSEIVKIKNANPKNKILVMSHDRSTINDLKSIREEAFRADETRSFDIKQIRNNSNGKQIVTYKERNSDYQAMLENIYRFAYTDMPDDPAFGSIGNQMRQVMETFAKLIFNGDYKSMLIHDFAWKNFRLAKYRDEDYSEFNARNTWSKDILKKNISRSMFNTESHSNAINDMTLTESVYTTDELVKLARYVLLFMDSVAHEHLYSYLKYFLTSELGYRDFDMSYHLYELCFN